MNGNLEGGALHRRLRREVRGEVRFDALMRGLYATDASIYQVQPLGVGPAAELARALVLPALQEAQVSPGDALPLLWLDATPSLPAEAADVPPASPAPAPASRTEPEAEAA